MELEHQQQKIIEQLDVLNKEIARQNSLRARFLIGIVYGVGFFVGSAIIATIAFGILGPLFANIDWIRNAFETGTYLLRQ